MLFIKCFTFAAELNTRYKTNITVPYLHFEHCTRFQTIALNNAVDIVSFIPDAVTTFILYPIPVVFYLLPQVLWNGGYFIVSSMYYSLSDMDTFLIRMGFNVEPVSVVQPAPVIDVNTRRQNNHVR